MAGLGRGWRSDAESPPSHLLPASHMRLLTCTPLQVSPSEEYTAPPLPADEWEATYRGSMRHAEATLAAGVAQAAGPLQVRFPCCVLIPPPRRRVQIVAEDAVSSEVLEAEEFDAACQDSIHFARQIVDRAVDDCSSKVRPTSTAPPAAAPPCCRFHLLLLLPLEPGPL